MIHAFFLINRQGKTRLAKWYSENPTSKQREEQIKEVGQLVLTRNLKACNFVDWHGKWVVYKRFASLYFIMVVDPDYNELLALEIIQFIVEILDRYFNNVCELDIIFNFHKVYFLLDEMIMSG